MNSDEGDTGAALAAYLRRPDAARLRKRSALIAGHRTSISLENGFWRSLQEIASEKGTSANQLITEIDRERSGNLSSAIRLFVLAQTAGKSTE
jgi:predicted DNA-binding ribbon-helix-helix protein